MWGRPPAIVLLVAGFLYLSAASLVRFAAAVKSWSLLHTLYQPGAPEFLLASGLFFFVTSFVLAAGLWLRKRMAWKTALLFIPGYWLVAWLERAIMAMNSGQSTDWLFLLIYNLVMVLFGVALLFRKSTQRFIFSEAIES